MEIELAAVQNYFVFSHQCFGCTVHQRGVPSGLSLFQRCSLQSNACINECIKVIGLEMSPNMVKGDIVPVNALDMEMKAWIKLVNSSREVEPGPKRHHLENYSLP